jgi:hypothetical protein
VEESSLDASLDDSSTPVVWFWDLGPSSLTFTLESDLEVAETLLSVSAHTMPLLGCCASLMDFARNVQVERWVCKASQRMLCTSDGMDGCLGPALGKE